MSALVIFMIQRKKSNHKVVFVKPLAAPGWEDIAEGEVDSILFWKLHCGRNLPGLIRLEIHIKSRRYPKSDSENKESVILPVFKIRELPWPTNKILAGREPSKRYPLCPGKEDTRNNTSWSILEMQKLKERFLTSKKLQDAGSSCLLPLLAFYFESCPRWVEFGLSGSTRWHLHLYLSYPSD